jgi:hypothetical protein
MPDDTNEGGERLIGREQALGSGSPLLGQPGKDGRIQCVATAPVARSIPLNIRYVSTPHRGAETAAEVTTFILQ